MALLINDNQTLLNYVPNVFSNVQGETSLYDKINPWLTSAEKWFETHFASAAIMQFIRVQPDSKLNLARFAIVAEAMRNAIPNLDVVLTPNGFGIVSNTNIAPASKERIIRLISTLVEIRDTNIDLFLGCLQPDLYNWESSPSFKYFSATLFPRFDFPILCGHNKDLWLNYQSLHEQAIKIERRLANEFISPELMDALRFENIKQTLQGLRLETVMSLRAVVISEITTGKASPWDLADIVQTIRDNPETFPEWHASNTSKLFDPPIFTNKKDNRGYWF